MPREATASLGKVDGIYGVSVNVTYLGIPLTVFVDAEGNLEVGANWVNPFSSSTALVTQAVRDAGLSGEVAGQFSAQDQDATLISLAGPVEMVVFYLDGTGSPHLTLSLIDRPNRPAGGSRYGRSI